MPCRPRHSSVNSFTISFTRLLFTRSLKGRRESRLAPSATIASSRPEPRPHLLCSPKDLLAEGVLLFRTEAGRGKTRWLQCLLDPHVQEAEAVFVQSKQDVGKAVHEAAGGLAPNGLRKTGSQYTRPCPLCSKGAEPCSTPSHSSSATLHKTSECCFLRASWSPSDSYNFQAFK